MIDIKNDLEQRTVFIRMSGTISVEEMQTGFANYKRLTDAFRGKKHLVLADMRGLAPLKEKPAELLGELITYGRKHGVAWCAHISDSATMRLQAARLARQASPGDPVSIDVVSLEEAAKVLAEKRAGLGVEAA